MLKKYRARRIVVALTFLYSVLSVTFLFEIAQAKSARPVLWNVPAHGAAFFGRSIYVKEIQEKIRVGPVVVTGPSGVGKTALTHAYAKSFHGRYQVVWVFEPTKGMEKQMIQFAHKLHALKGKGKTLEIKTKEDAAHYVKTALRLSTFSWLLMFDGAASFAQVADYLPETHGQQGKHVLVSSLSGRTDGGVVNLKTLTDPEAATFLKHYLVSASDADIALLAKTLENHPLAMLQAASYIKATPGMGVPAYVAFFTKNKDAFWKSEQKALGDQPLLYTAIKMSIDKLKVQSPEDYTLLVAVSMLNTSKIERSLIEKDYAALSSGDMAGFGKILDVALILQEEKDAYKIQDYVRDVILKTADKDTLKTAANLNAKVFLAMFPEKIEDCVEVFDQNPSVFTHMVKLFDHSDMLSGDSALQIGIRLFFYSENRNRDFDFAVPYKEKVKNLFDHQNVSDPILSGIFYTYYGCTVLTGGTIDDSIVQFNKAYDLFKKANPQDARRQLVSLLVNELGFFYHWKGDLEAVRKYLDEAKSLQGDEENAYVLSSIAELETVYAQDLGQFEKSLEHINKSLSILDKDPVLRKTSGPFAGSLKACSLVKLGRYEEAYALSQNIYDVALEAAGGDTQDDMIGRISVYLAQSQNGLGKYKEGEKSAKQAIAIINKCYAGTHQIRRQGVAHMALGDAYMGQKKYKEALAQYKYAQDVFTRISSHLSFDDMSELYLKFVNLGIATKDEMTVRTYEGLHRKHFPIDYDRYIVLSSNAMKAGY